MYKFSKKNPTTIIQNTHARLNDCKTSQNSFFYFSPALKKYQFIIIYFVENLPKNYFSFSYPVTQ